MKTICPKCKTNLSYFYHVCDRDDREKDYFKCYSCGAWFDVRTKKRVCPITVFSRAINYNDEFSVKTTLRTLNTLTEASELILRY